MSMNLAKNKDSFNQLNYNKPLISIWIGQCISTIGSGVFSLALAWEVIRLTGSTLAMGTVLLASVLPKIVFSFFGGVYGERYSKKRIIQITDFLRLIIGLVWVLSLTSRSVSMMELYTLSIIYGLIQAFFSPTYNSILPELLKNNQIDRAVNINMLIFRISNLVSPVIGGVLITLVSFKSIILIDALSFGIAFLFSLVLPNIQVDIKKKESIISSFKTGFNYFYKHKVIMWSVLLITFANISAVTTSVNLPKLVQTDLLLGSKSFGIIVSSFGIGAFLTLILLSYAPIKKYEGKVYVFCLMISGIMFALVSFSNSIIHLVLIMLCVGATFAVISSISTIILQKETDKEYRSRVFGIAGVSSLLSPVGYLIWGAIGDFFGNNIVFLYAGLIMFIVAIFGSFTKLFNYSTDK